MNCGLYIPQHDIWMEEDEPLSKYSELLKTAVSTSLYMFWRIFSLYFFGALLTLLKDCIELKEKKEEVQLPPLWSVLLAGM